jgi:hypothetical protein
MDKKILDMVPQYSHDFGWDRPRTKTRLCYDFIIASINDILLDIRTVIPEHQRDFLWPPKKQEALIETVMSGRPMPNLTFNDDNQNLWVEDGHQRYMTLMKFYKNETQWNNKFFRDLTEDQRISFLTHKICILKYRDATMDERIQIFDDFQNGIPLTPGHRFHARNKTKLVKYAYESFLTPDKGYCNRFTELFCSHVKDTKTKKNLMNIMAIAGGVAHGANFITTSYDILGPILDKDFDEQKANKIVEKMLSIFEKVNKKIAINGKQKKKMWKTGYIMGYVLATLLVFPQDTVAWSERWINYMSDIHQGKNTIKLLQYNCPRSRNWNIKRWEVGYNNIRSPPIEFNQDTQKGDDSDDSDD